MPQTKMVTIANITYKFAGYSSVLLIFDYLFGSMYSSLWPLFTTVVVLTGVGAIADLVVVPRLGSIVSLLIGAEAMVLVIFVVPLMWPGNQVTLVRAILMTICIAPIEYVLHQYVLRWLFPDRA